MSWLSSLLDPAEVQYRVTGVRFTQGDARLHSVAVIIATSTQRFTSRFQNPQPVDPVSNRSKINATDAEVRVEATKAKYEVVKVGISNRRRKLRTVIGTAEFTLLSLDPPKQGNDPFTRTLHVETALLPSLNLKIDILVELKKPGLDGWRQYTAVPRSRQNSLASQISHSTNSSGQATLRHRTSRGVHVSSSRSVATSRSATPGLECSSKVLDSDTTSLSSQVSAQSQFSSATSIGMAKENMAHSSFGFDLNSDTIGVVFLEIVSIANLPRFRSLTGISFDMDPFVIMSFGRRVYKTPHRRHTVNPTFNCKIAFDVDKSEATYEVVFTVWDQDKITLNDRVAEASIPVSRIIAKQSPRQDSVTGLYDLDRHSPSVLLLPLVHEAGTAELVIKVYYYPMAAIRQQMWRGIIALHDKPVFGKPNQARGLSLAETRALLQSLGSTLDDSTIRQFFTKYTLDPDRDRLNEDLVVIELELLVQSMSAERVILFRICPICHKKNPQTKKISALQHLSICASRHWTESTAVLLDQRYVSSQQASKRWYANFFSKFSYGSYQLGAHSANILVQDRISGQISEEKMSTSVRLAIRVIYALGPVERRRFQRLLRKYTLRQGTKYSSESSSSSIEPFIKFHGLDMSEVLQPVKSFKTFNEFFYRELKPGARPCENADEPGTAVSMADCRLTIFPSVDAATSLWIKGKNFSVQRLLGDDYGKEAPRYASEGVVVIFRLAPQDYHRVHSPVDGVMGEPKHIDGHYYTVNPMAIRSSLDVFGENVRTVFPIDSPQFGRVMIVMVGAMMVGSCVVTRKAGDEVKRTDELGYFKFGGSTCVALFEKGRIVPDSDLQANSSVKIETLVKVGMSVGHSEGIPEYTRSYDTRRTTITRARTNISGGGSYLPFSLD